MRDNGIGIAADQLPHIFDLFAQADSSLERNESGLGIGLTLVKRLVEMHGGTVTAERRTRGWHGEDRLFADAGTGRRLDTRSARRPGPGQDDDRARSLAAGFDSHLTKPVDFEALAAEIASLPACS